MNDPITIDASKARADFFKILDEVYTNEKSFLIKKAGVPIAELVKSRPKRKNDILKFAGAWKDIDTDSMIKYIYEGRKDAGELGRKLPDLK